MSTTELPRCTVRYDDGPCPNAASAGMPICGPCLGVLLAEEDAGRRRSLASLGRLPAAVLARLVDDRDAGVRARVAARGDLDADTIARYADPTRERGPAVWRALAATPGGAAHAASLERTGDRLTLLVLATNSEVPADVAAGLAAHDDPEIARTARATRAGEPPEGHVLRQVLDTRSIPTRPIATPVRGTLRPGTNRGASRPAAGGPLPPPEGGPPATSSDEPKNHRGLLIGFVVLVALVAIAAFLVATQGGGSSGHHATEADSTSVTTAATSTPSTTPAPSTTITGSTTTSQGAGTIEPVVLQLTLTAKKGRFCKTVDLRIAYEAPTARAEVRDDAGHVVWKGPWPAGSTQTITLVEPTQNLHVALTATADSAKFRPSGSVDGTVC